MIRIAANHVVSLNYKLHAGDGVILDESPLEEPMHYLHGVSQLAPGLESRLEGLEIGHSGTFVVPVEEGYGPRDPEAVREVPRSDFPPHIQLEPGATVYAEGETGQPFQITIMELRGENVVVDLNHPLAGKSLHFDVAIKHVRPASPEELAREYARREGRPPRNGGGGCGCGNGGCGGGGGGGGCGCGGGGCGCG